ncbi:MAG: FAD-dependent oxidoreductase [Methanomassiliicoccales archaeon]
MARKIVVIGSGAAGLTAASAARRHDPTAEITVFTMDEFIAYSPCAIPYVIEGRIKDFDSLVMHTPEFYKERRKIDVRTKVKVIALDVDKKTLTTSEGRSYDFDSIVIATGGTVFLPPVEGIDLKGVFSVRTISDGKGIKEMLPKVRSVVIAGAGVIGLEMAVAMRKTGKEVTVVEMLPQVVPRIMDQDMANMLQSKLESLGINFVLNAPIKAIKGKEKVEAVVAGAENYPCQMVIMATGIRANLEIPNMIGLDIGPLGGVRVSATLQPYRKGRMVSDVYLAGDIIQCESAVAPGPTMSQLGSSAVRQGEVAGINAAGGYATYPGVASAWVSYLGEVQVAGTGLSKALAEYYGIRVVEGLAKGLTRARYYPDGKELIVKVIADASTHKLIGAQILSGEEATGRINWLTAAIIKGVTVEEFSNAFENAYCPPTSMVKDVVNQAIDELLSRLKD